MQTTFKEQPQLRLTLVANDEVFSLCPARFFSPFFLLMHDRFETRLKKLFRNSPRQLLHIQSITAFSQKQTISSHLNL